MNAEVRSWTKESTEDFLSVVRSRFPKGTERVIQLILANPLCEKCRECGDIAYEDGVPKVVQAAVLRRMYFGQKELYGVVGSTLAAEKDASPISIINVMKRTIAPRFDSQIYFGNTACAVSLKMNRLLKVVGIGPESCAQRRFSAIRPLRFLFYVIRRKIFRLSIPNWCASLPPLDESWERQFASSGCVKRLVKIAPAVFDSFWAEYLSGNKGLVCSRSSQELQWMFGDRLSSGKIVILGRFDGARLVGYIVLESAGCSARRWNIVDWIALNNDRVWLTDLLLSAKLFLRQRTPAMLIESVGFPFWVQPLLSRHLKGVSKFPTNHALWKVTDARLEEELGNIVESPDHWFFGPYDGDVCMN